MNKNESKYFRTAQKMDEALLMLLEKKEFSFITVKEICEAAGVNRSTFYLHYETTDDLLKETVQYILAKHNSYYSIDKTDMMKRLACEDKQQLIFVTGEYLKPYLLFIKENRRLFKVAVKHFHVLNMGEVYEQLFQTIFDPILARFRIAPDERPYVIKFYLTGVFAVVMEWLERECRDDPEHVMKVITDCVIGTWKTNEE